MGIKGTVRRSTDGHMIHANIDTDVMISEQPPFGSTQKPEELYSIIEHFALGRRRLELFGSDRNIRAGWVTLGNKITSSNFNKEVPETLPLLTLQQISTTTCLNPLAAHLTPLHHRTKFSNEVPELSSLHVGLHPDLCSSPYPRPHSLP